MKLLLQIALVSIISFTANAQVKLLSFKEVQNRVSNGGDTTFVLNFWATWCVPCVAELPAFEKLHQSKLNKPVKVLLLSIDAKSKLNTQVVPFLKKHKITAETIVLDIKDQQLFIDEVDQGWSGALSCTLVINSKARRRDFFEKQFTYQELITLVQK